MNTLPVILQEEILVRLDPKSLMMMRCTNKSLEHITKDPSFKSLYWSRTGPSLLHIGVNGSNLACFHPVGDVRPFHSEGLSETICFILGYCSGLILIYVHGCFCVANPLTKEYRFLEYCYLQSKKSIGFAVDQINKTTQRFKIVSITELAGPSQDEALYGFHVCSGNSWEISQTMVTCLSRNLRRDMKPVYFQGSLYWLRGDGSIIVFNTETEIAGLIPTTFDQQVGAELLLGAGENHLTLISATEEMVYLYALENTFTDHPKWILKRRIKNEPVEGRMLSCWYVEGFDGRHVLVRAKDEIEDVIYGYDLRAKMWEVVGLLPEWCDSARDVYQFKPSWSSVIGLQDRNYGSLFTFFTMFRSQREVSVKAIMELIHGHFRI
ncbi:hypothetical protein N665_0064s0021 [Sinapis alba]|nr:hypothetical protein N665_0064s0021 [Sinapis alba]